MNTIISKRLEKLLFSFVLVFFSLAWSTASAQVYGPELIPQGTFGTIATDGKNGDNGVGTHIYPTAAVATVGTYYQPAQKIWASNKLQNISVNPTMTIGKPINNKTTYNWGLNQTWSELGATFPNKSNNQNSWITVAHAPNEGNYVIATTTKGMYNAPSVPDEWPVTMYDRYETDTKNPTNYFMVVDADLDSKKIFYKEEVNVISGQVYRMSVDIAQLNRLGAAPNVAFVISSSPNNLSTITPVASIIPNGIGKWTNSFFDYVVPCGVSKVYVAFRNNVAGFGNDIALDNLSMKQVMPHIAPEILPEGECGKELKLELAATAGFSASTYLKKWQRLVKGVWTDIASAKTSIFVVKEEGTYRLATYTTATAGCPMLSNEITVLKAGDCMVVGKAVARDDSYDTYPEVTLTGDLLPNDSPSVNGAELKVVKYEVNGTTYSAGTSALIYDGTLFVGVVTINQNGTFTFKSVPNLKFPYQVPPVKYTIAETGGGQASAYLRIRVTDFPAPNINVNYDASCIHCPIVVSLYGPDLSATKTYSLYRGSVKKGTFSAGSYALTFNEIASGKFEYTVQEASGKVVKTFEMEVHPQSATWNADALTSVWAKEGNWKTTTGGSYPIWCTDVTIPTNSTTFPVLVDGDACRDITMKDHASVGQIQKLTYRKAFVEMNPTRNRWYMLSAPLRYMYSADLHGDMTWTNSISPKIFMMYFDIKSDMNPDGRLGYAVGNFSRPFSRLEEPLVTGRSYALWVNGKQNGFDYADNNFPTGTPYNFPRLVNGQEPVFNYHDTKTGEWLRPTEVLNRGNEAGIASDANWLSTKGKLTDAQKNNRYRFIFEESIVNSKIEIAVQPSALNSVANPFMSHLDFERFVLDNKEKIQGFYRIWDGEKFYLYVSDNVANFAWTGLGGLSTETADVLANQYIAPMQSFFVVTKAGVTSLTFDASKIAGTNTTSKLRAAKATPADLLKFELKMDGSKSQTIVGVRAGATTAYDADEDIQKLFAPGGYTPEIYTIAGETESIELNIVNADATAHQIPVGIRTDFVGAGEITVSGLEAFAAYGDVKLKDALLNQTYDLRKTSTIKFNKTAKTNLENRFFIVFEKRGSSIDETGNQDGILVTYENGVIDIVSTQSELQTVVLFDANGKKVFEKNELNEFDYQVRYSQLNSGVYFLKVSNSDSFKTVKLIF